MGYLNAIQSEYLLRNYKGLIESFSSDTEKGRLKIKCTKECARTAFLAAEVSTASMYDAYGFIQHYKGTKLDYVILNSGIPGAILSFLDDDELFQLTKVNRCMRHAARTLFCHNKAGMLGYEGNIPAVALSVRTSVILEAKKFIGDYHTETEKNCNKLLARKIDMKSLTAIELMLLFSYLPNRGVCQEFRIKVLQTIHLKPLQQDEATRLAKLLINGFIFDSSVSAIPMLAHLGKWGFVGDSDSLLEFVIHIFKKIPFKQCNGSPFSCNFSSIDEIVRLDPGLNVAGFIFRLLIKIGDNFFHSRENFKEFVWKMILYYLRNGGDINHQINGKGILYVLLKEVIKNHSKDQLSDFYRFLNFLICQGLDMSEIYPLLNQGKVMVSDLPSRLVADLDPNIPTRAQYGFNTPLHDVVIALKRDISSYRCSLAQLKKASLLVANGANREAIDYAGKNPLQMVQDWDQDMNVFWNSEREKQAKAHQVRNILHALLETGRDFTYLIPESDDF